MTMIIVMIVPLHNEQFILVIDFDWLTLSND